MKSKITIIIIISIFLVMFENRISKSDDSGMDINNIRSSILAGTWYPGSEKHLNRLVRTYLSKTKTDPLLPNIKALIVPHAGYKYSGQIAAYAYKHLQKSGFKRIILIGPSHRYGFNGVSVNLQSGYQTPLGIVLVDKKFANALIKKSSIVKHIPNAHVSEHSLEIQIPFLQTVLPNFHIVPMVMGRWNFSTATRLANSLAEMLAGSSDTLLILSTDLSHYHPYEQAKKLDNEFIKHIRAIDAEALYNSLGSEKCEACGAGPAITGLLTAQKLGAKHAAILKYANSGDVTGDKGRVVGYLSAALY